MELQNNDSLVISTISDATKSVPKPTKRVLDEDTYTEVIFLFLLFLLNFISLWGWVQQGMGILP